MRIEDFSTMDKMLIKTAIIESMERLMGEQEYNDSIGKEDDSVMGCYNRLIYLRNVIDGKEEYKEWEVK